MDFNKNTIMNITHLFKTYYPNTQGGLEEAIRQISKFTLKNGYSIKVVSTSKIPFDGELDGIKCKSFYHSQGNDSSPFSIELVKNFKSIVNNSDILHLHFPWPTGELLTLFFNVKKPIVITFHCDIQKRFFLRTLYTPFIRKLFKKAKVIIPTSENLMNSTPILSEFKDKCKPINLWLDEDRFLKLSIPDIDFQSEVSKYGDYCLFVGVLRWYKGLDCLLDASKTIKGNIVIVGKGPLYLKLKKRIEVEKINNVFLLGFQSDENVKYLINKSRFIVLPSISPAEAFGQILLEASYFCKPMITTELGSGTSFVNLNNKTGFVVEPSNSNFLTEKCNILFNNNNLVEEYGRNAYIRYKENFTELIQGIKYVDIYNNITKKL